MDAKRQERIIWTRNQTMQIIIQDETFNRDMKIQWQYSLLPKCFSLSSMFRSTKDKNIECFSLIVDPRDVIGAVKAYIQEEKGIAFKKQMLLKENGENNLSDEQTLDSLGIKKGSTLILRYAPVTQISVRMLMLCSIVKDPWSLSRKMEIVIHDDTYKDTIHSTKDGRVPYTLMVDPNDTIAAVKAYIQEKTGLSIKNQDLLMNEVVVLRDLETLISLGITKGSILTLRYAPIWKQTLTTPRGLIDDRFIDIKTIKYTRLASWISIGW